jgi:hypothetical protein
LPQGYKAERSESKKICCKARVTSQCIERGVDPEPPGNQQIRNLQQLLEQSDRLIRLSREQVYLDQQMPVVRPSQIRITMNHRALVEGGAAVSFAPNTSSARRPRSKGGRCPQPGHVLQSGGPTPIYDTSAFGSSVPVTSSLCLSNTEGQPP